MKAFLLILLLCLSHQTLAAIIVYNVTFAPDPVIDQTETTDTTDTIDASNTIATSTLTESTDTNNIAFSTITTEQASSTPTTTEQTSSVPTVTEQTPISQTSSTDPTTPSQTSSSTIDTTPISPTIDTASVTTETATTTQANTIDSTSPISEPISSTNANQPEIQESKEESDNGDESCKKKHKHLQAPFISQRNFKVVYQCPAKNRGKSQKSLFNIGETIIILPDSRKYTLSFVSDLVFTRNLSNNSPIQLIVKLNGDSKTLKLKSGKQAHNIKIEGVRGVNHLKFIMNSNNFCQGLAFVNINKLAISVAE